jgi:hypothetical protein
VQSRDATLAATLRALAHQRIDTPDAARALKGALARLSGAEDPIQSGLQAYRPDRKQPGVAAALHRLLERQHYRLAHWQLSSSEINYRRFFDINTLAALRVEHLPAFEAIHPLVSSTCRHSRPSIRSCCGLSAMVGCTDCGSITSMDCGIRISIAVGCKTRLAALSPAAPGLSTPWSRRSSSPTKPCRASPGSLERPATSG